MFINNVEYNIRLYVFDPDTDEDITEKLFEDLDQMAGFIKKTYQDDKYVDAKAIYTFVEVVDGVPDKAGTYFYEVHPYYPLDEDDLDETLQDMAVEAPKHKERLKKEWEEESEFHPSADQFEAGDGSKDIPLSEYSYVCPHCFNEVENCTCRSYPYTLIQIDKLMVPIIKELNYKGYMTMYCCAGHPDYQTKGDNPFIDIMFKEDYVFPEQFPNGAVFRKSSNTLSYEYPDNMDSDMLKKYQNDCLNALLHWARSL